MTLLTIFIILLAHYVSDFIFQTKEMANNKSKSGFWLSVHCFVYGTGLFSILFLTGILSFIEINDYLWLVLFAYGNAFIHFIVDYITSRGTNKMHLQRRYRAFFNIIGLDQLIHTMTLLITFKILL